MGDERSEEFKVSKPLHSTLVNVNRGWVCPVPAEVYHHLFNFRGVQNQVVYRAPNSEFVDISMQAYCCCVSVLPQ